MSTTSSRNVERLREAYELWNQTKGRSSDRFIELIAEDFHFGSLGEGRDGRPAYFHSIRSRTDLRAYFDGLTRDWRMIEYVVGEFIAQGDAVVMRGHCSWEFRRTGKVCATPKVDLWRFRDGKVIEFYEMFDTAAMLEATTL